MGREYLNPYRSCEFDQYDNTPCELPGRVAGTVSGSQSGSMESHRDASAGTLRNRSPCFPHPHAAGLCLTERIYQLLLESQIPRKMAGTGSGSQSGSMKSGGSGGSAGSEYPGEMGPLEAGALREVP